MRCPHRDVGCEYTGERNLLASHLKLQCPYVQIPCPCSDEGCQRTVARRDAAEGKPAVHQDLGPEVRTPLSFTRRKMASLCICTSQSDDVHTTACESCEKEFPSVPAMNDHLANSCLEKIVPCRQAGNGCAWKGRRVSLETHVDNCPYESIKGFFAIHGTQMAQLSKENDRLRRRTDELEGIIRILGQELEWAKLALGPWYRAVYPERPPISANCTQRPSDEGAGAGPWPSQVGQIHLQDMDPTDGTSLPEPRVENGATETFDFFDPFSFISQRRDRVSSNAPTTTNATNTDTNTSGRTIESHGVRDPSRDAASGSGPSGPGSSNGPGSIHYATMTALSPGADNSQSMPPASPVVLLSDHFPSEGGSFSRTQSWQRVSPPPAPMPPNPSPSIRSPVSITVLEFG